MSTTLRQLQEIIIYGASDDCVEIDGLIRDEHYVDGDNRCLLLVKQNQYEVFVEAAFDCDGHVESPEGWVISVKHGNASPWPFPIEFHPRPDNDEDPAVHLFVPEGATVRKVDRATF